MEQSEVKWYIVEGEIHFPGDDEFDYSRPCDPRVAAVSHEQAIEIAQQQEGKYFYPTRARLAA